MSVKTFKDRGPLNGTSVKMFAGTTRKSSDSEIVARDGFKASGVRREWPSDSLFWGQVVLHASTPHSSHLTGGEDPPGGAGSENTAGKGYFHCVLMMLHPHGI